MSRADVDAVIALLTEDATWSMPPIPTWFRGQASIATFLAREPFRTPWRHVATEASGQPAVASYMWDDERGCYVAMALDVLTLRGAAIESVVGFLDGIHITRLGLPASLRAVR
jgi:RNA polymerase sigma-70 factor (ECF subfamily)